MAAQADSFESALFIISGGSHVPAQQWYSPPMQPDSRTGFFLTFEGLDGSGKTTQIRRLTAWLAERDLPHILTRQPGGTETGDRIRALLLDSKSAGLAPRTELAMMFADRAQSIEEIIAPALAARRWRWNSPKQASAWR